jgi:hypothetical protein
MNHSLITLSLCPLIAAIALNSAQAQDNPKPSSWRNINIKVTETYGNNQSRPLRGAKVILELENGENNAGLTTRIPQTKTTGPRGAQFTRMPPSSMVGKYRVTVDPKPNNRTDSYSCKKEQKISYTTLGGQQRSSTSHATKVNPLLHPLLPEEMQKTIKKGRVTKSEFKCRMGGEIQPIKQLVSGQMADG